LPHIVLKDDVLQALERITPSHPVSPDITDYQQIFGR
jgi:hypothetical protein